MNFYKLWQSKQAAKDIDEGTAISIKPTSLRYSYDVNDDNTQKMWAPTTKQEKETLSPEGYHRVGERAGKKDEIYKGIFESAKANAQKEQNKKFFGLGRFFAAARKKAIDEKARKEADKQFEDNYTERQISIPSTAISDIKYSPKSEGLNVKFQGGKISYFYPRVPLELVQAWLKAPSKGEFFMKNIHDQYSIFGKNHGKKTEAQHKGMRVYEKSYKTKNKNHKIGG